ncbi:MAG: hypothetical protein NDI60_08140 [Elusimicrobiales bacterium]|nr:hypothetical protein [Elusimicrobiales bacterium]
MYTGNSMSISSHLSPDPERRLLVIHDGVRRAAEWTDLKLGLLTLLAALELPWAAGLAPAGALSYAAGALLCAALMVALAALSPFTELVRQLPLLDQPVGRMQAEDSMLLPSDLARYPHTELVFRLDKFLGGGITATKYYEDIVARIIALARAGSRKRRLLLASGVLVMAAQLLLGAALLLR